MNIAAWLQGLGLRQYEQAFRENDIDSEVLADLTADDLIGIGVTSVESAASGMRSDSLGVQPDIFSRRRGIESLCFRHFRIHAMGLEVQLTTRQ